MHHSLFYCRQEGESLPTTVNPTSSRTPPRHQGGTRKPPPKVMSARHLSGGKRTQDTIEQQKAKQGTNDFVPAPGSMFTDIDIYYYQMHRPDHFIPSENKFSCELS